MLAFHFNCVPREGQGDGLSFWQSFQPVWREQPLFHQRRQAVFAHCRRASLQPPAAGDVGAGAAQDEGYGDHGCFHLCFLELP